MLESHCAMLQASLDYLEQELDIAPEQVHEAEVDCRPGHYGFLGSVLFPELHCETFLARDRSGKPGVYHLNDYLEFFTTC